MAHYLISTQSNKTAYDLASNSKVRHCLTERPVRNHTAVFKCMITLYTCVQVTKPETEIGVST